MASKKFASLLVVGEGNSREKWWTGDFNKEIKGRRLLWRESSPKVGLVTFVCTKDIKKRTCIS